MKTKIAVFISTLFYTMPSMAIELHKDDINEVHLRGYIAETYLSTEEADRIVDLGSRWGFDVKRKIQAGWVAGFTAEWGLSFNNNTNLVSGSGSSQAPLGEARDDMTARLGYVHFKHDNWGSIGIGKQWSVYFDAVAATDAFAFWGTNANGAFNLNTDGGLSGTGRAEQVLTYRNTVNGIKYGLQIQAQDEQVTWKNPAGTVTPVIPDGTVIATIGNSYGATVGYRWENSIEVNAAHNVSDINLNNTFFTDSGDDIASAVSISYGDRSATKPGLYAALVYVVNENHQIDDTGTYFDGKGWEYIAKYTFHNTISAHIGVNHMEADDSNYAGEYEYHDTMIGVTYPFHNNVGVLFFETRINDSTSSVGENNDDTEYAVGVRYMLF